MINSLCYSNSPPVIKGSSRGSGPDSGKNPKGERIRWRISFRVQMPRDFRRIRDHARTSTGQGGTHGDRARKRAAKSCTGHTEFATRFRSWFAPGPVSVDRVFTTEPQTPRRGRAGGAPGRIGGISVVSAPCTTNIKVLAKKERILQHHGITVGIGIAVAVAIAIENSA